MNEIAERVRKTVNESDHPGDFVSAARTACIEIDLLQSKLGEVQKYWDDEKRRYDAADKAFRLVCDERDALQSRLHNALKENERLDAIILAANKARVDWPPDHQPLDVFSDCPCAVCKPAVVENRRDLFSELKEGLESIPVENQTTIKPGDLMAVTREFLKTAPSVENIVNAQMLCNCEAKEGEQHSDGCNTISRLVQIGALSE